MTVRIIEIEELLELAGKQEVNRSEYPEGQDYE